MATITAALEKQAKSYDEYKRYHPYLFMTERFIGDKPSFYPILTLSEAAINTHVGLFARMFHAPEVDMRVPGFLSVDLRRTAFLAASDNFNCDYCTAHAFCFGDMMRGSIASQMRRGGLADPSPNPETMSEDERAVYLFAKTAVRRPFFDSGDETLAAMGEKTAALIGDRGLEIVKAVIAFSGALNTIMDIQGVTLEAESQVLTQDRYKPEGSGTFKVGEHHYNSSAEANEKFVNSGMGGLKGVMANVSGMMTVMPHAVAAMSFETFTLYAGIPSNAKELDAWVESRLGPDGAAFFKNMKGKELKRAFCFGLRENVLPDEKCASGAERKWTLEQRLSFLHVFALETGSKDLVRDVAAMMSVHCEMTHEKAATTLEGFAEAEAGTLDATEAAGRRLTIAAASGLDRITESIVTEVTSACEPEAVLELASIISFAEMWRRLSLLFQL